MLELWYAALVEDFGVVVETSDPKLAAQQLYRARREASDPALEGLSLRTSPLLPDEEIWIVKNVKKIT